MAAVLMLPFIIRVVASSLSNFDFAIEEAALSLGAGRFATFFKVVLPNIRSGIIAAILIAFLESFNNVDISVFMTGPGVSTLPMNSISSDARKLNVDRRHSTSCGAYTEASAVRRMFLASG